VLANNASAPLGVARYGLVNDPDYCWKSTFRPQHWTVILRCRRDTFLSLHQIFRDPLAQQIGVDFVLLRDPGNRHTREERSLDKCALTFFVVTATPVLATTNYS
jgi:hypothetical protein